MKVNDPVCGADVDVADVADHVEHDGWAYFFCSKKCARRFAAAPQRYAVGPVRKHAERTASAGGSSATGD